jgi:hypothetical protein
MKTFDIALTFTLSGLAAFFLAALSLLIKSATLGFLSLLFAVVSLILFVVFLFAIAFIDS